MSTMFSPLKKAGVSGFVTMQQAGKDLDENESFYWWPALRVIEGSHADFWV